MSYPLIDRATSDPNIGYAIYPSCALVAGKRAAIIKARELSAADRSCEYRVEDSYTGKVVARFNSGAEG